MTVKDIPEEEFKKLRALVLSERVRRLKERLPMDTPFIVPNEIDRQMVLDCGYVNWLKIRLDRMFGIPLVWAHPLLNVKKD